MAVVECLMNVMKIVIAQSVSIRAKPVILKHLFAVTCMLVRQQELAITVTLVQTYSRNGYALHQVVLLSSLVLTKNDDKMNCAIPTYIINLKKRIDRKEHIVVQFTNRAEFNVTVIDAIEHTCGAIGLWMTIRSIAEKAIEDEQEYVIICEDDHQFTEAYSNELFYACILEANKKEADLLSGGVSWANGVLPVAPNLYWMEKFSGLQFTVIFKRCFRRILDADFSELDAADYKLSSIAGNMYFIHPFLSVQREFGYSDVTIKNNLEGRVDELFRRSSESVRLLDHVKRHYETLLCSADHDITEDFSISTYLIGQSKNGFIYEEFLDRHEFDVNIISGDISDDIGRWKCIRGAVEKSIATDDDVIIICDADHLFTGIYTKSFLVQNIMEAHVCGADVLYGGVTGFSHAIPVTRSLYWINPAFSTQFIVIYRRMFDKILQEELADNMKVDACISELSSNKLVIFPFISQSASFLSENKVQQSRLERMRSVLNLDGHQISGSL